MKLDQKKKKYLTKLYERTSCGLYSMVTYTDQCFSAFVKTHFEDGKAAMCA